MVADQKNTNGSVVSRPDWLKQELFEPIMKENVPHYKKITKFEAHGAVAPGENYATEVLRVEVEVELEDGRQRTMSYILKASLQNEEFKALLKQLQTFERETGMYMEIVPELQQIYKDAGLDVKFAAKAFHLDAPDDIECLLLEDLCVGGFKNVNRLDCLDMEHTKSVLKKMAQWHAASAVRVESKGMYDEFYTIGHFKEESRAFMENMNNVIGTSLLKAMSTYNGHELWKNDIEIYHKKLTNELFKTAKYNLNEFNVLNHGDLWCNNIMFQYDAFGKIKETYFVDYQIPKYGTPAQDLLYFLLSSTQLDIKLKNFDYFIKYYHDNLIENLTLLKYPKSPPSLKELHILLHKHSVWAHATVTGVMAAVLVDRVKTANLDNFLGESAEGDAFKMLMYTNERYRQNAEAILPWLYNRGTYDCC